MDCQMNDFDDSKNFGLEVQNEFQQLNKTLDFMR